MQSSIVFGRQRQSLVTKNQLLLMIRLNFLFFSDNQRRSIRKRWIEAKYVHKLFMESKTPSLSPNSAALKVNFTLPGEAETVHKPDPPVIVTG